MFKKSLVMLAVLALTAAVMIGCEEDPANDNGDQVSAPEQFDNRIVGIDAGAEIMDTVENDLMPAYGLEDDYELIESSDAAMVAELQSAIRDEEWIAVIGWTPHWKFAEWDLKFLEDPEGILGEEENIKALSRTGLPEDMPDVTEALENYLLTDEQLGEVMGMIEEMDDEEEAVAEWAEENQDTIQEWVPEGADGEGETVELLLNNWADAIASTNLIAHVLEEEMNYDVEMEMVDVAFVFQGLANDEFDAMVCAWLPLTQSNYWDEYGDDLEDLGPIFEGAKVGLVAPEYVEIDSIDEMGE